MLSACLATLMTSCSSDEGAGSGAVDGSPQEAAIDVALADDRLPAQVQRASAVATAHGDQWVVTVPLEPAVPDAQFPLDVCSAPHTGPVVAVDLLVGTDPLEVQAIGPVWEDNRCITPPS